MARSKRSRTRAKSRSNQKVKLHQLAQLITPQQLEPSFLREAKVRTDLPVFVCGTNATIDPANPTNLGRIARDAIREAETHLGVRAAHGLGENTTVIIQTANGWMVRNRHGDIDNVTVHGQIASIDERAQSKRANRERRNEREQERLNVHLKNRSLATLRKERGEAIRQAMILLDR